MNEDFVPLVRHHRNGTLTIAGRHFKPVLTVKKVEVIEDGEFNWFCASCLQEVSAADEYCRRCGAELKGFERRRGARINERL